MKTGKQETCTSSARAAFVINTKTSEYMRDERATSMAVGAIPDGDNSSDNKITQSDNIVQEIHPTNKPWVKATHPHNEFTLSV